MAFLDTPWRRRGFSLARFEPAPLEFETEVDEPLARSAPDSGQHRGPAECNLSSAQDSRPIDAAAELRQALGRLRRSLR